MPPTVNSLHLQEFSQAGRSGGSAIVGSPHQDSMFGRALEPQEGESLPFVVDLLIAGMQGTCQPARVRWEPVKSTGRRAFERALEWQAGIRNVLNDTDVRCTGGRCQAHNGY